MVRSHSSVLRFSKMTSVNVTPKAVLQVNVRAHLPEEGSFPEEGPGEVVLPRGRKCSQGSQKALLPF